MKSIVTSSLPEHIKNQCYQEIDGFWYYDPLYYDPVSRGGSWSAYGLRQLADYLDELNKPWQDCIDKYFDTMREDCV